MKKNVSAFGIVTHVCDIPGFFFVDNRDIKHARQKAEKILQHAPLFHYLIRPCSQGGYALSVTLPYDPATKMIKTYYSHSQLGERLASIESIIAIGSDRIKSDMKDVKGVRFMPLVPISKDIIASVYPPQG